MRIDPALASNHPFAADDFSKLETLKDIMAALREPETGCPWDIEQTFTTIAPYTIEEAYEVAEAIAQNDLVSLREELGDLLLQVVYHARMAEEEDAFTLEDVVHDICVKMIRRHPHVFGDEATRAAGVTKGFWERIKAEEKSAKPDADKASVLDDIPFALPALMRAVKLQKKAARVGFDWPDISEVVLKAEEELQELSEAASASSAEHVAEEVGDFLFVAANLARHHNVDPEDALRKANEKFTRRFHYIEEQLAKEGRKPSDSDLKEMDALWDASKAAGL